MMRLQIRRSTTLLIFVGAMFTCIDVIGSSGNSPNPWNQGLPQGNNSANTAPLDYSYFSHTEIPENPELSQTHGNLQSIFSEQQNFDQPQIFGQSWDPNPRQSSVRSQGISPVLNFDYSEDFPQQQDPVQPLDFTGIRSFDQPRTSAYSVEPDQHQNLDRDYHQTQDQQQFFFQPLDLSETQNFHFAQNTGKFQNFHHTQDIDQLPASSLSYDPPERSENPAHVGSYQLVPTLENIFQTPVYLDDIQHGFDFPTEPNYEINLPDISTSNYGELLAASGEIPAQETNYGALDVSDYTVDSFHILDNSLFTSSNHGAPNVSDYTVDPFYAVNESSEFPTYQHGEEQANPMPELYGNPAIPTSSEIQTFDVTANPTGSSFESEIGPSEFPEFNLYSDPVQTKKHRLGKEPLQIHPTQHRQSSILTRGAKYFTTDSEISNKIVQNLSLAERNRQKTDEDKANIRKQPVKFITVQCVNGVLKTRQISPLLPQHYEIFECMDIPKPRLSRLKGPDSNFCKGSAQDRVMIEFSKLKQSQTLIDLCIKDQRTLYVKVELDNSLIGQETFDLNVEDLYAEMGAHYYFQQEQIIESLISTHFYNQLTRNRTFYLKPGHLAGRSDFVYRIEQTASFVACNTAPMWSNLADNNWRIIELAVSYFAAHRNSTAKLIVYAGTEGFQEHPAQIYHQRRPHKMQILYLLTGGEKQRYHEKDYHYVPNLFYKIAYDPESGACVAIVAHNTTYPIEKQRCKNVTNGVPWLSNYLLPSEVENGIAYACYCGKGFGQFYPEDFPELPVASDRLLTE